jgi:hypothetical protein
VRDAYGIFPSQISSSTRGKSFPVGELVGIKEINIAREIPVSMANDSAPADNVAQSLHKFSISGVY